MNDFSQYLSRIDNPQHRARMEEIFGWITQKFPALLPKIAWNQPMFTHHGTFIIGFSAAKQHMAVAPEEAVIDQFSDEIARAGYSRTKGIIRIKWDSPVDYSLLAKMIELNISEKKNCETSLRGYIFRRASIRLAFSLFVRALRLMPWPFF